MRQAITTITIRTDGPGLHPIDGPVRGWVKGQARRGSGLLTLLCQHTSASLTIQENADPDVRLDLQDAFTALAPHGHPPGGQPYRHATEGPDDMAAHVRTVLSGVHLSIPVEEGRLMLGTWQGLYLWEHRDAPHDRRIAAHVLVSTER
ncbi:MAG: secondary thiamine-phosphate synthase enzyme YjbQ [Pseudomonadota bacterium]